MAGKFFQVLALIPFAIAKHLWTFINLAAVSIGMLIVTKLSKVTNKYESLMITGISVCLFLPLIIHLERGQIDAITFLLLIGAITLLIKKKNKYFAGILLALTTLLKLHCIYFIPFLILRKE